MYDAAMNENVSPARNAAGPASTIHENLAYLRNELERIQQIVTRLQDKVSCVSRATPGLAQEKKGAPQGYSEIGNIVGVNVVLASDIADSLNYVIDSLDL